MSDLNKIRIYCTLCLPIINSELNINCYNYTVIIVEDPYANLLIGLAQIKIGKKTDRQQFHRLRSDLSSGVIIFFSYKFFSKE